MLPFPHHAIVPPHEGTLLGTKTMAERVRFQRPVSPAGLQICGLTFALAWMLGEVGLSTCTSCEVHMAAQELQGPSRAACLWWVPVSPVMLGYPPLHSTAMAMEAFCLTPRSFWPGPDPA